MSGHWLEKIWKDVDLPLRYKWRGYLLDKHVYGKYKGKPHDKRCILNHRRKFSSLDKCMAYAKRHPDEYAVFCAIERMKRGGGDG